MVTTADRPGSWRQPHDHSSASGRQRPTAHLYRPALAYIRRLYAVEREAKEQFEKQRSREGTRTLAEIRYELRRRDSVGILDEFQTWMRRQADGVDEHGQPLPEGPALPKSPMGRAIDYCLNNWAALCRYASDGDLDIDNNAAERLMRPIAVGRNNWTFFGSDNGGATAAVLYSLIATARRHKLDPFAYLRDVLGRISDHPAHQLETLLPDQWKKMQQAAAQQNEDTEGENNQSENRQG